MGFIFVSPEDIRHNLKWKKITKKRISLLQDMLKKEFQVLKNYVEGDTYILYCKDDDCFYENGTYDELEKIFNEQYSKYGILIEETEV